MDEEETRSYYPIQPVDSVKMAAFSFAPAMAAKRFVSKLRGEPDGCWEFVWFRGQRAGHFWVDGKLEEACQMAYLWAYGERPGAIAHTCGNPSCCNPGHILLDPPET